MSRWPTVEAEDVTWIDAPTMAEIDRVTIEDAGVLLIQMMENAGRSLAQFVRQEYSPRRVIVLAGSGGNGGGGLVAARHLINAGVEVAVVLSSDWERFGEVPAHQLAAVEWLGAGVTVGVLPNEAMVEADSTLTLCLPKEGLRQRPEVGRLFLADITVPSAVVSTVTGRDGPPFDRGPILEIAAS